METKLSKQKQIIVDILRDLKYHCGREWLDQIKDDRKRIGELNEGYMKDHGFVIKGYPCNGRACGRPKCPLYMRRAEKITNPLQEKPPTSEYLDSLRRSQITWFDKELENKI